MPETTVVETRESTLQNHLMGEPLPVRDVLRYAVNIANALRQVHEQGAMYGCLEPSQIVLTDSGAWLCPAELRPGQPTGDIFAFGAILYEMLTGSKPAETELQPAAGRDAESAQLLRIAMKCLAKDPEQRYQHVQKILMELKLLTMRRLDRGTAEKPEPVLAGRAQVAQMESRLATRIGSQEIALAELSKNVEAIRQVQAELRAGLAAIEQRATARLAAQDDHIEALHRRAEERVGEVVSSLRQLVAAVEQSVAGQLHGLEDGLRAQGRTVESMKVAMSQTDDLIERVVDAFHALQESILEQSENGGDRTAPAADVATYLAKRPEV